MTSVNIKCSVSVYYFSRNIVMMFDTYLRGIVKTNIFLYGDKLKLAAATSFLAGLSGDNPLESSSRMISADLDDDDELREEEVEGGIMR